MAEQGAIPSDKRRRVLVIGADLVMPKLFYFTDHLKSLGYGYAVYTHDDTDYSRRVAKNAGATFLAGPPHRPTIRRMLRDILMALLVIRRRDYHHADLYCDYHILAASAYLLVLKLKGIPVVLWCRGLLEDWDNFAWWQRLFFRTAMHASQLVVLKERYMIDTLTRAGVYASDKTIELHNTVPVRNRERVPILSAPEIRLLFLNSFVPMRHVGFCADLAAALRDRDVRFSMTIAGEKDSSALLISEASSLKQAIACHGVEQMVTIAPFSKDPQSFYREHDIFLLPADRIYCNYALLEAMDCGLVPIVSDQDADYRFIIEEGVSGFGRSLDAGEWARIVAELAADRERAQRMSDAARLRVAERFSTARMFTRYAFHSGLIERAENGLAK
ncbi:glycosyltransferase family 4 protein [Methylosinus sp. PW1]|uniref:glycosyltransferase family 4 protein n=1 Tax=Methylosinus sp. PW1 TaxID=107636 RepID=UPI00055E21F7|nr:glycosyltransferase family 4 protein [Methylosinus sp. PW1]